MIDSDAFKESLGTQYVYPLQPTGYITTRIPYLDYIIGRPGIPLSRLSILTGIEASGKTTLALQLAAQVQAQGGIVMYIDAEHKLDEDYAKVLGVDTDDLVLARPEHLEQAFKIMARSVATTAEFPDISVDSPVLMVLDSIDAMPTKADSEADWEATNVAPTARVMSRLLRRVLKLIADKPIALLFISQVRTVIGSISYTKDVSGGWAPRFYSSLTIKLFRKKGSIIKYKGREAGATATAKVIKSQIASPFKECPIDIMWGKGVDYWKSVFDLAAHLEIIEIHGAWFAIEWKGKEKKWGKRQAGWPEKNPAIVQYILAQIEKRLSA
jgi:recombination protein RecA